MPIPSAPPAPRGVSLLDVRQDPTVMLRVLAALAQRWWLRSAPGQAVALEPGTILRPTFGMRMRLKRRAP